MSRHSVVTAAIIVAFFGFTRPGHLVVYKAGFTAACGSSESASDPSQ